MAVMESFISMDDTGFGGCVPQASFTHHTNTCRTEPGFARVTQLVKTGGSCEPVWPSGKVLGW